MFSPSIFRANDIRGLWKKDFDLSFTKELAFALVQLAKQKRVKSPKFLIGYDARLSSPSISNNLARYLKTQGCQVSEIGLAPSPLCYFLTHHYKLTACVVITASHNPVEFNGFKILFHKKHKILKPIPFLKKILSQKREQNKVFKKSGHFVLLDKEKPYIDSLKKELKIPPVPFVVDTGNGALGPLAKKVFKSLGLKVKFLYEKPDGPFSSSSP